MAKYEYEIDETDYSRLIYAIARDTEITKLEVENRNLKLQIEDLQKKLDYYFEIRSVNK